MSRLTIACEVERATPIDDAAQEIVNLSRRLDVNVRCQFNGTPLYATPNTTAAEVMSQWEAGVGKRGRWEHQP